MTFRLWRCLYLQPYVSFISMITVNSTLGAAYSQGLVSFCCSSFQVNWSNQHEWSVCMYTLCTYKGKPPSINLPIRSFQMNEWWWIELLMLTGPRCLPWNMTSYLLCFPNAGVHPLCSWRYPLMECFFCDAYRIILQRAKLLSLLTSPQRPTVKKKLWYRSLLPVQPKQVGKGKDQAHKVH